MEGVEFEATPQKANSRLSNIVIEFRIVSNLLGSIM
jgi:hypothetical protein